MKSHQISQYKEKLSEKFVLETKFQGNNISTKLNSDGASQMRDRVSESENWRVATSSRT